MYVKKERFAKTKHSILHELIDTHILPRLPLDSLARFKSVSKHWYSVISSHAFHKEQLQYQASTSTTRSVLIESEAGTSSLMTLSLNFCILRVTVEPEAVILEKSRQEPDYLFQSSKVIGSCRGLICIYFMNSNHFGDEHYLLWNPVTRERRLVNQPDDGFKAEHLFSGFGYDSLSDDYKVVYVGRSEATCGNIEYRRQSKAMYKPIVCLFTLRTQKWRKVHKPSFPIDTNRDLSLYSAARQHVLVGETLNWLFRNSQLHWNLVAFDLTKESFSLIPLPSLIDGIYKDVFLCEIRQSLCVCVVCYSSFTNLKVWKIERHGTQNSCWRQLFEFDTANENLWDNFHMSKCLFEVQGDRFLVISKSTGNMILIKTREDHKHMYEILRSKDACGICV